MTHNLGLDLKRRLERRREYIRSLFVLNKCCRRLKSFLFSLAESFLDFVVLEQSFSDCQLVDK